MADLPPLALSVRQPWAWAIIFGGKVIENRSPGAIRSGGMDCRRIAIHAASAMTEKEFRWGYWRLKRHGVRCPLPHELARSAIIGSVSVVDIVTQSDSPWFGARPGNAGLVLENPVPCDPVPAKGALGYFEWQPSGALASAKPWMKAYQSSGDGNQSDMFADAPLQFDGEPERPFD